MPQWSRGAMLLWLVAGAAAFPSRAPSTAADVNWTLTFEDDFDGTVLNASTWHVHDNWTHCCPQELSLYVKEAVSVSDGFLVIRTDRTPQPVAGPGGQPFNFTSGWLDSKASFAQHTGRFEANMSLPSTDDSGIWPAFWLMPNSTQCWPTGGEVDIMEFVGNPLGEAADRIWGSYHWQRNQSACGEDLEPVPGAPYPPLSKTVDKDWQTDFHVSVA
jgi:beta-glucanase (GH16 family)